MRELLSLTIGLPEVTLDPGDVLLSEGDATGRLYVLLEGSLMVRRGDEDFMPIEAPGACVGEMAVLLGRPHTATVIARTPCRLRVMEDAQATLRDDPAVLRSVAELLARRLDLVNHYLADLQHQYGHLEGGLGMVGDMLKHLAGHHGEPSDPGSEREPDPLY